MIVNAKLHNRSVMQLTLATTRTSFIGSSHSMLCRLIGFERAVETDSLLVGLEQGGTLKTFASISNGSQLAGRVCEGGNSRVVMHLCRPAHFDKACKIPGEVELEMPYHYL